MIQISIEEPKIEKFFNHSKDEILKALKFIADNNIKDFTNNPKDLNLSIEQKKELNNRETSFHNNPSTGRSWDEIKNNL